VQRLYLNGVWAVQHQTIVNEPLGTSTGEANQSFFVRQLPLLGGEAIEVRELAGMRANVEWRTVALELFNNDARVVGELEKDIVRQALTDEIVRGDLRLVRDRMRRVTEVWVRWYGQPHFYASTSKDRHYVPDRVRGAIQFGNHSQGKVPPIGALIQAKRYQAGGGVVGNVPALTVKQLVGPIGGVEEVFNPFPGAGGGDRETVESYASRAPRTLKRRGRALTIQDYEVLAREANANVAVAKAVSCRDAEGHRSPGWVTVFITPRTIDPEIWPLATLPDEVLRPWPSFGLREEVQRFIQLAVPACTEESHQVMVTGPIYKPVGVKVTIAPLDSSEAGTVEHSVRRRLETFLHPLFGGPDAEGWEPGRSVYLSDMASVIERVDGVDYVQQAQLFLGDQLQGGWAPMREGQVVVPGPIEITMVVGER
jgi:predicted phage baseplate assembly protein